MLYVGIRKFFLAINEIVLDGVLHVFFMSAPFKIASVVVSRISIDMVYLFKTMFVMAKSYCDKTVNFMSFAKIVNPKAHLFVASAFSAYGLRKNLAFDAPKRPILTGNCSINAPYKATRADLIDPFVSSHISPVNSICHAVVYGNKRG